MNLILLSYVLEVMMLVLCMIGIALWFCWSQSHPNAWRYAVGPLTWLMHMSVFYAVAIPCNLFDPIAAWVVLWSIVIRMHAVFTAIGIGWILLHESRL